MKSEGYWKPFWSGHKIFLSILTLTYIAGYLGNDLGTMWLCILVFIIYTIIQVTKLVRKRKK